jgi:hypothetical protein
MLATEQLQHYYPTDVLFTVIMAVVVLVLVVVVIIIMIIMVQWVWER